MLFLASLIGMDKSAPSTRSMLGVPAAAASIVLCLISSVLLVGIWFNASGIESLITGSSLTPNLAKLAGHISGVFDKSLLFMWPSRCKASCKFSVPPLWAKVRSLTRRATESPHLHHVNRATHSLQIDGAFSVASSWQRVKMTST